MENYKNNNQDAASQGQNVAVEDLTRTAFEYSLPTNDTDDTESNKSTPYYTPLEFFQSSFEFPSPKPKLEKVPSFTDDSTSSTPNKLEHTDTEVCMEQLETSSKKLSFPKQFSTPPMKQMTSTSPPVINRKIRRFSLYERRSCSPQHVLRESGLFVDDKENTKPLVLEKNEDNIQIISSSGNNSPNALIEESGSPKILAANEASLLASSRFTYSPKLLASINNLNIAGSPLGVISSAGYKNGNYFKFPEIDHVVQENTANADVQTEESVGTCDNQICSRPQKSILSKLENPSAKSRFKSTSLDMESVHMSSRNAQTTANDENEFKCNQTELSKLSAISSRSNSCKNRKNKNNLTIRIEAPTGAQPTQLLPVPKPKTPTIKSTKEKALSLDSAAQVAHSSCDEIDAQPLKVDTDQLIQRSCGNINPAARTVSASTNRSTSLSQLSTFADTANAVWKPTGHRFGEPGFVRTPRRRVFGSTNSDWLQHRRKQNAFQSDIAKKLGADEESYDKASGDMGNVVILKEDDEVQCDDGGKMCSKHIQCASPSNSTLTASLSNARGIFKHNPLLHASNTNLKTLPEFLTLVEFTTTGPKEPEYPFKQKSMDLPSSTMTQAHPPVSIRTKSIASASSTNLLQRRGSNHSLTLNLHGSCSNLLGCRGGLSVSNYNLGSAANSTTNLNSKSSGNLDLSTTTTPQPVNVSTPCPTTTTQGAKQSLFRRRGSNHSLTLTSLNANSCGNLNSFASQNCLNVDRALAANAIGVTRTTSFITPTNNTASSTTTTPKRGLLERRGSNQSLTLNMSSSFGGIGSDRNALIANNFYFGEESDSNPKIVLPTCASQAHQRKFFSSESLNKANNQFSDLNQAHRRDAAQVCFGSVADLKPGEFAAPPGATAENVKPHHFDFQESTVCTCTGVRNIMTRPLSPQTTSEEFKVYLANIQMLQNATNALNQVELIKLNHIFDNSYASNNKNINQSLPLLNMHGNREAETPPGLQSTSEDCEVAERYQEVIRGVLETLELDDTQQKRMFCDLHKEFWDLPLNHQEKPMVFGSQTKNRYKTILPNENSRVILDKEHKPLTELTVPSADLTADISQQQLIAEEVPYINANYIKGPDYTSKCYVATQGPLPNTIYEFWLMIYQNMQRHIQASEHASIIDTTVEASFPQYYQKIIMLTNFLENSRQKCSAYFPVELNEIFIPMDKRESLPTTDLLTDFFSEYLKPNGDFTSSSIECIKTEIGAELRQCLPSNLNFFVIKNIGIVKKNGFSIRKLIVLYCSNVPSDPNTLLMQKFYCYHYWYPDWPDHRSPRDINTLLDICLHILNLGKCEAEFETYTSSESLATTTPTHLDAQPVQLYQQDIFNAVQPLPVIHCSAGIGRTGCLTAILNGIRQLRQSLAYSLTSMAAAASKHGAVAQALSPIDFCLPTTFLEEIKDVGIELNNDTDSSYTRNTLLYVRYILTKHREILKHQELQQQQQQQQLQQEDEYPESISMTDTTSIALTGTSCWQLPSLAELPKMPDIFVDILGIVCNLRLQRGGMVQNSEQYELIHRAICLYLKRTFALKRF